MNVWQIFSISLRCVQSGIFLSDAFSSILFLSFHSFFRSIFMFFWKKTFWTWYHIASIIFLMHRVIFFTLFPINYIENEITMFKRSCRGSIVVSHNSSVINFLWLLVSSENFVERDIFDYIFPVKSTDDAKIELNDVRYFEIFIISGSVFFWHNFLTNGVIVSLTKPLHFV